MKRVSVKKLFSAGVFVVSMLVATQASAEGIKGRGLVLMDPIAYQSLTPAATRSRGPLPEKVDLSAHFPKPGDQGRQGSCVGWAAAYLMSYRQSKKLGVSPQMFSPAFTFNQVANPGCNGSAIYKHLDLLQKIGTVPLNDFPYDETTCTRKPSSEVIKKAGNHKISGYQRLTNVRDISEVKRHLSEDSPVIIAMSVDYPFQELEDYVYSLYTKGVHGYLWADSWHAMVVVGYDEHKKAFRLINSWRTTWGDDGFGWVDYDTFSKRVAEGYVIKL